MTRVACQRQTRAYLTFMLLLRALSSLLYTLILRFQYQILFKVKLEIRLQENFRPKRNNSHLIHSVAPEIQAVYLFYYYYILWAVSKFPSTFCFADSYHKTDGTTKANYARSLCLTPTSISNMLNCSQSGQSSSKLSSLVFRTIRL